MGIHVCTLKYSKYMGKLQATILLIFHGWGVEMIIGLAKGTFLPISYK